MSIPYAMNPLGVGGGGDIFIEIVGGAFASSWPLWYSSPKPLPVYQGAEIIGAFPAQAAMAETAISAIFMPGETYKIVLNGRAVLASGLHRLGPTFVKIRGYSPPTLGDLFYGCRNLTQIDVIEEELTRRCVEGWRVFADCDQLVFTPTARYWWENPTWTGNHQYVFRGCTSMPNYNQIPASWGGGGN